MGAVFTYYLKDEILTQKEIRQKKEKELIEADKSVSYPSFQEMRAEDDENKPKLIFTVRDEKNYIIRTLETDPGKGIHRITWDFHYPTKTPATVSVPSFEDPFSEPDRGPLALPGNYSVSMAKLQNGVLTELVPPVTFSTKLLGNTTLPASDQEALLSFEKEVAEILRVVRGTSKTLDELKEKLQFIKVAINHTSGFSDDIFLKVADIDQRLKDLDRKLNGDYSLTKREFPVPPSITARVNTIVNGLYLSTSAPTATQKSSLEIVKNDFNTVYSGIKKIAEEEMISLEKQLENAEAPWTPGRLPDWEK
jgi:hypothetical protein